MPENQLMMPETSDDAQQMVQQILDNPRELGPSVQVRFAKRVGKPGASRVMMMDAQTVGPAGEEHEDSESKLALRLADGTNVQLSLSFFNENQPALAGVGSGGGGRRVAYSPFNSYTFEPRSYAVSENGSKLPGIMIGMAFVLGASAYGVFNLSGRVAEHDRALMKTSKSAPVIAAAKAPATTVKTVAPKQTIAAPKISSEVIPPAPSTEDASTAKSVGKKSNSIKVSRSSHSRSNRTTHADSGMGGGGNFGFVPPPPPVAFSTPPIAKGFVPPPPPTPYTVPTGIPAAFDPLAALAPATAHSNRPYVAPARKIQPVSMSTISPEVATMQPQLSAPIHQSIPAAMPAQHLSPLSTPVQQFAPSSGDRPVVQQYSDGLPASE